MRINAWPGYPDRIMHVEASPWRVNKAEERRFAAEELSALNQDADA